MSEFDLKALWQSTEQTERPEVDPEIMKQRAQAFERKVWRRNALEWVAAAFVFIWFGHDAIGSENTVEMVGNTLVAMAAIGIAVYLYLKGRIKTTSDPTSDTQTYMKAHAQILFDQARLLAGVPLWYLGPLSLGMIVLQWGRMPTDGQQMGAWLSVVVLVTAVFLGIAWLNHRGAKKLRHEAQMLLSELDETSPQ